MEKKALIKVLGIVLVIMAFGVSYAANGELERYFLAFTKADQQTVAVRFSDDGGATWKDGNFPAQATLGKVFDGVGAASDSSGLMHIVFFNEPNAINMVWGLGPAVWDNSGRASTSFPTASAPSAVFIAKDRMLVAFQRSGDTVAAEIYDHSAGQRRFIADIAPQNPLNTSVAGRPAVTNMNGKILLAWRRWYSGQFHLITAIGQVESGTVAFSLPQEIPLPTDTQFRAGLSTDPDVTNNDNRFFMAFGREERGTGSGAGDPLHGWRVPVLSSADGVSWNQHSINFSLAVTTNTAITIAALSDETLFAAAIKSNGTISAARFSNGSWNSVSASGVFGVNNASSKQFALFSENIFRMNPNISCCATRR